MAATTVELNHLQLEQQHNKQFNKEVNALNKDAKQLMHTDNALTMIDRSVIDVSLHGLLNELESIRHKLILVYTDPMATIDNMRYMFPYLIKNLDDVQNDSLHLLHENIQGINVVRDLMIQCRQLQDRIEHRQ